MERNNLFDFYKGILMWGVIWGHCVTSLLNGDDNNVSIHLLFRTYDMPFFMLISGYFLTFSIKKYSLKQLLFNKVTTILLPTVFWGLINSHNIGSSFYFLYSVFFSSIIIIIADKCLHNKWVRNTFVVLIITVLHLQSYRLWNMPYLFPYFVIGYWGCIINRKFNIAVVLTIFVACFCYWDSSYTIWNAGANLLQPNGVALALFFRTIIAITGIVVFREFMNILYVYLERSGEKTLRFILDCGKNTLALYILHSIVLGHFINRIVRLICRHVEFNPFNYNDMVLGYVYAPWLSVFIMWLLLFVIRWCKAHKYTNKLFGFKI